MASKVVSRSPFSGRIAGSGFRRTAPIGLTVVTHDGSKPQMKALSRGHKLALVVGVFPGGVLFITRAHLRDIPIKEWTVKQIFVVWLSVPTGFYIVALAERMITETILPLGNGKIVPFAYGMCFTLAAVAIGVTLYWLRYFRPAT